MVKPEWGKKRVCLGCSVKFYDLMKSPILCPKCGAEFDPDVFLKKKSKAIAAESKPKDDIVAIIDQDEDALIADVVPDHDMDVDPEQDLGDAEHLDEHH